MWNLNDNELHFEAHLECRKNTIILAFNQIAGEIKEVLHHEFKISQCTIQPEFGVQCSKDLIARD